MTLATGVPALSLTDAAALAREHFGVDGTASPLPSERDRNVLLRTADGARFVLKVAHADAEPAQLEAECALMLRLRELRANGRSLCPVPVHAASTPAPLVQAGAHLVRLITAVDGVPLATAPLHTDALRTDVGRALGAMHVALDGFDHAALHRSLDWDLARAPEVVARHAALVTDPAMRAAVHAVESHHRLQVAPLLPGFRRSVIHGDMNDYNVLVDPARQGVTGIVDFGDASVSHSVNDVAIAMAYVALGADDPMAAAARVAAGYHAVRPLYDDELSALFGLMTMRLAVSACMAAHQQAARPDHDYLGISQGPIRRTLPQLVATHPRLAHYMIREACALAPVPQAARVSQWIAEQRASGTLAPVLGSELADEPIVPLDFSVGSALIASEPAENTPELLDARINRLLAEHGARIGVGGYDEPRLIYRWPNEPHRHRAAHDPPRASTSPPPRARRSSPRSRGWCTASSSPTATTTTVP